jgi:hypothetical protein
LIPYEGYINTNQECLGSPHNRKACTYGPVVTIINVWNALVDDPTITLIYVILLCICIYFAGAVTLSSAQRLLFAMTRDKAFITSWA